MLGDGLIQRFSGNEQKAGGRLGVRPCRERDAVARIGKNRHLATWHLDGVAIGVLQLCAAPVHVHERVVGRGQWLAEAGTPGREMHVQIQRFGRELACRAVHGALGTVADAGDHAHRDTLGRGELGDARALDVAVPGRAQLVFGGQVEPQLKAFHCAFALLRHFAVDHAAPGGHPLNAAVGNQPFVTGAVLVAHATAQHVAHGFKAAVRMAGEPGAVVVGVIAAEGVQHEEGVQPALQVLREHPCEFDTRAVARGLAGDEAFHAAGLGDDGFGHAVVLAMSGLSLGMFRPARGSRCSLWCRHRKTWRGRVRSAARLRAGGA